MRHTEPALTDGSEMSRKNAIRDTARCQVSNNPGERFETVS